MIQPGLDGGSVPRVSRGHRCGSLARPIWEQSTARLGHHRNGQGLGRGTWMDLMLCVRLRKSASAVSQSSNGVSRLPETMAILRYDRPLVEGTVVVNRIIRGSVARARTRTSRTVHGQKLWCLLPSSTTFLVPPLELVLVNSFDAHRDTLRSEGPLKKIHPGACCLLGSMVDSPGIRMHVPRGRGWYIVFDQRDSRPSERAKLPFRTSTGRSTDCNPFLLAGERGD